MFVVFFMNKIFLYFGILNPITTMNLSITLGVIIVIFSILAYLTDKNYILDFKTQSYCLKKCSLSPISLFSILIPFSSILGTYLMNFYQSNFLLILMFFMISVVLIFFSFTNCIGKKFYPFLIFLISISLVYHVSLFSTNLWGGDIYTEHYFSNLVLKNSFWDSTIPGNVNSTLSVVLLAPVFSNICNLTLTSVFKIIYPFFLSLVPVGLYKVFESQTDKKIAFLSCFFFISLFIYYFWMALMPRQIVAEVFLVLLMMVIVDKKISNAIKSFLFILFSFSMIVSHYGLSDLFLLCIIFVYLSILTTKFAKKNIFFLEYNTVKKIAVNRDYNNISLNIVILYFVFLVSWSIYVSTSSVFSTLINIGKNIVNNLVSEFMDPAVTGGMGTILMNTASPLHELNKYIHILAQIFIVVGLLKVFFGKNKYNFHQNYLLFSIASFLLLIFSIVIPYFSLAMTTSRIYHVTLFFLAPFFVIGITFITNLIKSIGNNNFGLEFQISPMKMASVFLIIFLFFNTGLIYEISNDVPTSIPLNSTIDSTVFNDGECFAANWLLDTRYDHGIYADSNRIRALGFFTHYRKNQLPSSISDVPIGSYIYIGSFNLENNLLFNGKKSLDFKIIELQNKVYDNNCAEVYYVFNGV
ncbi:DUF2206 domain-containing protein [Methanosarcina sp. WWM596]|uniref:DUF2206 domain-containing protein n=1 Tax=Methanosarcina sp. WWM596 TaxID=1434103 RepID=UPI001E4F0A0A|nr:DUF2206 domain-containing protein [Methanosarcina sp. WWM596]